MAAQNNINKSKTKAVIPLILLFCILWSMVVAASLIWNVNKTKEEFISLARNEAVGMFNKDQGFRFWGTQHGGVYVPVSDHTPPSPYLAHIPERDIETPSGKKLTLMNPAYMVRQLMEYYNELYGTRGHITGLVLLRPENAPDEWEVEALKAFINDGVQEVSTITAIDGKPFLRLMRPMVMQKACEKCHGHLGFKEGDIRGGVSVSVPLESFDNRQKAQSRVLFLTHGGVWLIGLLFIGFGGNKIRNSLRETLEAEAEVRCLNRDLEDRVAERTKELHEKEQRLRMTVENAADGIIVINEKGNIDTFNGSAQRIFGYSPEEVIGKNVAMLMPPSEASMHQKYLERFLDTGSATVLGFGREVVAQRKNGECFPLHLAVSKAHPGERVLFSAICRDLSEQKKTAQELIRAKSEAEHASQAKSEFLSSMSHELRTPLNSIIGFSQLLTLPHSGALSESQREKVDQIQEAGMHLLSLINDILDLSRIETQGFNLTLEPVSLRDVLTACLQLIEAQAQKREVRIYDDVAIKDLPQVMGDYVRLKQVINHLLSNAVKYNVRGGQVVVSAEIVDKRLRLSISDTGAGIAEHQIPHVFEPFNRLGQENGEVEGTGIGLSITKKLVESMQGSIALESVVNSGSVFSIELPIARPE